MPVERTSERLKRILVLVPWVIANPDPTVDEVCARFGMTPQELSDDLEMLFMCGLPPFGPGDLIEAYIEGDRVVIRMADYLARPPRLTRSEATMLLVMGRAVAALPGMGEAEALRSALDKLRVAVAPTDATGTAQMTERISIELESAGAEMMAVLRDAIARRERLRISYFSAGRDEMTEREVDPLLVFGAKAEWYLVAFDHRSGEERLFRVDRVRDARPTGEKFDPPADFDPAAYGDESVFTPSERDIEATIDLGPGAAWVREVLPHETASSAPDGSTRLMLRTPHLAWLVRLVLQLGDAVRVVEPPELRDAVRAAARRALARYPG